MGAAELVRAQRVHYLVEEAQWGVPHHLQLLPVDVLVRDEGGTAVHRIELTERNQIFELPVAGQPTFVRFDHGGWIPKTLTWEKKKATEWLFIAHEDEAKCCAVAVRLRLRDPPSMRDKSR